MGNIGSNDKKQNGGGSGKFIEDIHKKDDDFELKNGRVYLKGGGGGFVAFYAPWCHFCTELAPSWNQYSEKLNNTSFKFLAVDCTRTECKNTVSALNIRGYPTIKYIESRTGEIVAAEYRDGSPIERSREGISRFLKEKRVL
jgi:thiol-disulfide isomerase/thioredoxin